MKTVPFLVTAAALLSGCSHHLSPPATVSASVPSKLSVPPPSASEADLAIAAVQAYKPNGSKKSIQDWVALGTVSSKLTGFKDVGWGAVPRADKWEATYVFIGVDGKEHRAEWEVVLPTRSVTPTNSAAKQIVEHTKAL